jgi:hypothetical protein
LVEHCTENAGVGGSIPPLGTITKFGLIPLSLPNAGRIGFGIGWLGEIKCI